jgi:hypothetical protein
VLLVLRGWLVGGKTGTSDKVVGGRYSKTKVLTSFTAVLPADQPHYMLLIILDEPQALPETHGFTTSGWNAVPVGGAVISRIAPLLGIEPRWDLAPSDKLILACAGGRCARSLGCARMGRSALCQEETLARVTRSLRRCVRVARGVDQGRAPWQS